MKHYMNSDWTYEKDNLEFRTIEYLQIGRLPHGMRFVVQDGHKKGGIDKYAAFSKSGTLVKISCGNTIKEAKTKALSEINKSLRNVALIKKNPTHQDFLEALNKFK